MSEPTLKELLEQATARPLAVFRIPGIDAECPEEIVIHSTHGRRFVAQIGPPNGKTDAEERNISDAQLFVRLANSAEQVQDALEQIEISGGLEIGRIARNAIALLDGRKP